MKRGRFDKEYRKVKRLYDNELKIDIAEFETRNPKDFWNKLKSLGRNSSKTCLPSEVRLENGEISSDKQSVLNKWRQDFSTVYNLSNPQVEIDLD